MEATDGSHLWRSVLEVSVRDNALMEDTVGNHFGKQWKSLLGVTAGNHDGIHCWKPQMEVTVGSHSWKSLLEVIEGSHSRKSLL